MIEERGFNNMAKRMDADDARATLVAIAIVVFVGGGSIGIADILGVIDIGAIVNQIWTNVTTIDFPDYSTPTPSEP